MGLETTEGTGRGPAKRMWKSRGIGRGMGMVGWSWQSACVCAVCSAVAVVVIWVAAQLAHPASYILYPASCIRNRRKKLPRLTWTYLRI